MPFSPTTPAPTRPTAVGQSGNLQILQRLVDSVKELQDAGLLIGGDVGSGGGGGVTPTDVAAAIAAAQPSPALAKLRAALVLRQVRRCRLVFAGSSTTAGSLATTVAGRWVNIFVTAAQNAFPNGLGSAETSVYTDTNGSWGTPSTAVGVHGFNIGHGGKVAADYLIASERVIVANLAPSAVFHMVGSNDFATGVSVATYKANVASVIADLKSKISGPCVHVLIQAYERSDASAHASKVAPWDSYGTALKELAAADPDNVAYIDLSPAYRQVGLTGNGALDPLGLLDTDRIHQNNSGHAFMADQMIDQCRIPRSSAAATAPPTPTAPSLTVSPGDGQYTVSQGTPGANWTTLELFTSTTNSSDLSGGTVRATSLPSTQAGTNNTAYYVQVRVTGPGGTALSAVVSVTPVAAGTGPTLVTDDFNRTGALHGSSTTTGGKTWFVGLIDVVTPANDGVVNLDGAATSVTGINSTHKAVIDLGTKDYVIETILSARNAAAASTGGGLFFRVSDDGYGYFLSIRVNSTTTGYALYKQDAAANLLLQNTSVTPSVGDVLRAEVSGSSVVLKVNGTALWTAHTMDLNLTATKVGYFFNATSDDSKYTSFTQVS